MYYGIVLIISAMLIVSTFAFVSLHTVAFVSFVKGKYDPSVIDASGGIILEEFESMGMIYISAPIGALASLAQNPAVEFIERDNRFEIAPASASEYSESWALEDVGAESLHLMDYTGKGVKIALLDTGVDYTHPELVYSYKGGYDFINNDSDPMDDNGHGTHVAGILAAAGDGEGIVGIAPDAEIYAIKISDKKGSGSFSGLVKGIDWSIKNGMDIVTMSITGQGGSKALAKAAQEAYEEHGLVMVAAVGNGQGDVLYPAAYEQVIGVGSVTSTNELSSFSRTGSEVELVAPGSGIKSAAIGGKYRLSSGTSMATPLVTGSIALLLESEEKLWKDAGVTNGDNVWTNDELRNVLRETAKDLGEKGRDNSFGYGLLNLDFLERQTVLFVASPEEMPEEEKAPVLGLGWFTFRLAMQSII